MAVDIVDTISTTGPRAVKFEEGFSYKIPMPQIEDPANPGQMVDEFASVKLQLRADIKRRYIRIANQGLKEKAASGGGVIASDGLD